MNKYSCYETDKCLIKIISAIEDNELILEFVSWKQLIEKSSMNILSHADVLGAGSPSRTIYKS